MYWLEDRTIGIIKMVHNHGNEIKLYFGEDDIKYIHKTKDLTIDEIYKRIKYAIVYLKVINLDILYTSDYYSSYFDPYKYILTEDNL